MQESNELKAKGLFFSTQPEVQNNIGTQKKEISQIKKDFDLNEIPQIIETFSQRELSPKVTFVQLIQESNVFDTFMLYVIELHKMDLLQYLHEKSVSMQSDTNKIIINNRIFSSTFKIKIKDKKISNDYFTKLASNLQIRELTDNKANLEICKQVCYSINEEWPQRVMYLYGVIFDALSYNEIVKNKSPIRYAWEEVWMDPSEKKLVEKETNPDHILEKTLEKRVKRLEEIKERKDFILKAAAFYMASQICDTVMLLEKAFELKCLWVEASTYNLQKISKKIYLEAIKQEQTKGIAIINFPDKHRVAGYYSIKPMGLLKKNEQQNSCDFSHNYIRAENIIYTLGEKYPLPSSWRALNSFNQKFPANRNITRLSNNQLLFLYEQLGIIQDCIFLEIPDIVSNQLIEQLDKEGSIIIAPKVNINIYDIFTACGISLMLTEGDIKDSNFDVIKSKSYSQFIRTKDRFYFYNKWEDKLILVTDNFKELQEIDKLFLHKKDTKQKKEINKLDNIQLTRIYSITSFTPNLSLIEEKEEKNKRRGLSDSFFSKLAPSSSRSSPSSSPGSSTPSPRADLTKSDASPKAKSMRSIAPEKHSAKISSSKLSKSSQSSRK